jgi:hypothetical protein
MQPVAKHRIGKHAYNNRGSVGNGFFLSGPYKVVIKKSSVQNRQTYVISLVLLVNSVNTDKWHNYGLTRTNDRPILSSERVPHKDRTVTFEKKKYLVMSPRRGSTSRQTDWLTVSCNVTLTLTLTLKIGNWVRGSKWAVNRELSSASEAEKMALWLQMWSVNQRATDAEESPLLRFVTRKRLVKIFQRKGHCWELLRSND